LWRVRRRLTDRRLTRAGAVTSQQRDATRRAVRGGSAAGPSYGARSGAAAELARIATVQTLLASPTPWAGAASSRASDRTTHDDRAPAHDPESADDSCSSISLVCCSILKDALACGLAAAARVSCERMKLHSRRAIAGLTDQALTRPRAHAGQQRDASRRACTRRFSAGPSYGTRSGAEPSWAAHRQRDGTLPRRQMFATGNTDNDIGAADSLRAIFLARTASSQNGRAEAAARECLPVSQDAFDGRCRAWARSECRPRAEAATDHACPCGEISATEAPKRMLDTVAPSTGHRARRARKSSSTARAVPGSRSELFVCQRSGSRKTKRAAHFHTVPKPLRQGMCFVAVFRSTYAADESRLAPKYNSADGAKSWSVQSAQRRRR
jgi:hypothetical protein